MGATRPSTRFRRDRRGEGGSLAAAVAPRRRTVRPDRDEGSAAAARRGTVSRGGTATRTRRPRTIHVAAATPPRALDGLFMWQPRRRRERSTDYPCGSRDGAASARRQIQLAAATAPRALDGLSMWQPRRRRDMRADDPCGSTPKARGRDERTKGRRGRARAIGMGSCNCASACWGDICACTLVARQSEPDRLNLCGNQTSRCISFAYPAAGPRPALDDDGIATLQRSSEAFSRVQLASNPSTRPRNIHVAPRGGAATRPGRRHRRSKPFSRPMSPSPPTFDRPADDPRPTRALDRPRNSHVAPRGGAATHPAKTVGLLYRASSSSRSPAAFDPRPRRCRGPVATSDASTRAAPRVVRRVRPPDVGRRLDGHAQPAAVRVWPQQRGGGERREH